MLLFRLKKQNSKSKWDIAFSPFPNESCKIISTSSEFQCLIMQSDWSLKRGKSKRFYVKDWYFCKIYTNKNPDINSKCTQCTKLWTIQVQEKRKWKKLKKNSKPNENSKSQSLLLTKFNLLTFPGAFSRCSHLQMFFNIRISKNVAIFSGRHLCWSLFLIKL